MRRTCFISNDFLVIYFIETVLSIVFSYYFCVSELNPHYVLCIKNTTFCDLGLLHRFLMNDRRGHRKLRLTSRKHFKPKPKRSIPTRLSPELEQPDYQISLPLEAYVDAPVNCLNSLLNRLKNCGTIPSGT